MLLNACVRINISKHLRKKYMQWKDWEKVILNSNYNKLNLSIWVNVL